MFQFYLTISTDFTLQYSGTLQSSVMVKEDSSGLLLQVLCKTTVMIQHYSGHVLVHLEGTMVIQPSQYHLFFRYMCDYSFVSSLKHCSFLGKFEQKKKKVQH